MSNVKKKSLDNLKAMLEAKLNGVKDEANKIRTSSDSDEVKAAKMSALIKSVLAEVKQELKAEGVVADFEEISSDVNQITLSTELGDASLKATVVEVDNAKSVAAALASLKGHAEQKPAPMLSPNPVKQALLTAVDELHNMWHLQLIGKLEVMCNMIQALEPDPKGGMPGETDGAGGVKSFSEIVLVIVTKHLESLASLCTLHRALEKNGVPGKEHPVCSTLVN